MVGGGGIVAANSRPTLMRLQWSKRDEIWWRAVLEDWETPVQKSANSHDGISKCVGQQFRVVGEERK